MPYRIMIEITNGDYTIKTRKDRPTADGIQQVKNMVRGNVARGSIVKFTVKEI